MSSSGAKGLNSTPWRRRSFGDVASRIFNLVLERRFVVALTCRPIYPCRYSQEARLVPHRTWTCGNGEGICLYLGTRPRPSYALAAFVCVYGTRLWLILACSAQDICCEIAALRFKKKKNPKRWNYKEQREPQSRGMWGNGFYLFIWRMGREALVTLWS